MLSRRFLVQHRQITLFGLSTSLLIISKMAIVPEYEAVGIGFGLMKCVSYLCQLAALGQHFLGLFRQLPLLGREHLKKNKSSFSCSIANSLILITLVVSKRSQQARRMVTTLVMQNHKYVEVMCFQTDKWGIEVKQFHFLRNSNINFC